MIWYKIKTRGFVEPAICLTIGMLCVTAINLLLRLIKNEFGTIPMLVACAILVISINFVNKVISVVSAPGKYISYVMRISSINSDHGTLHNGCPFCNASASKIGISLLGKKVGVKYSCGTVTHEIRLTYKSVVVHRCRFGTSAGEEDVI